MTVNLKNVDNFKVEYYLDTTKDALTTILIRAAGADGFEQAKAKAKAKSVATGDITYAVACGADGETMGHIVYSEGRISSRAGCLA